MDARCRGLWEKTSGKSSSVQRWQGIALRGLILSSPTEVGQKAHNHLAGNVSGADSN